MHRLLGKAAWMGAGVSALLSVAVASRKESSGDESVVVQDENKHVKHESLLHTAKNMKLEKVETLPSDFFSKDGLTFTETFPNKPIEKDIALRRVMFSYRGWMKNSGLMPDYLRTKKMVPVAFTIHLEKKYGETESEKCLKPIESSINTQATIGSVIGSALVYAASNKMLAGSQNWTNRVVLAMVAYTVVYGIFESMGLDMMQDKYHECIRPALESSQHPKDAVYRLWVREHPGIFPHLREDITLPSFDQDIEILHQEGLLTGPLPRPSFAASKSSKASSLPPKDISTEPDTYTDIAQLPESPTSDTYAPPSLSEAETKRKPTRESRPRYPTPSVKPGRAQSYSKETEDAYDNGSEDFHADADTQTLRIGKNAEQENEKDWS